MWMRSAPITRAREAEPARRVQGNANSSDFVNINWTHTFNSHLFNQTGANLIRPYGANLTQAATKGFRTSTSTTWRDSGHGRRATSSQSTYSWRDVMTATIKTHTLKFGADLFNTREVDHQQGAFTRPTFNYRNLLDLIQDEPVYSSGSGREPAKPPAGALRPRLSRPHRGILPAGRLEAGAAVHPEPGRSLRHDGQLLQHLQSHVDQIQPGNRFDAECPDRRRHGRPGKFPHVLDHNIGGFTPRVGFSWDVFGKGKTAVRGGFGMFEDQPPYLHITDITAGNLPNFYTPSDNIRQGNDAEFPTLQQIGGLGRACPVVNTSNATIGSSGRLLVGGVVRRATMGGYDPNFKMPQVVACSLSVQQQLQTNLIVELNYSGTESHHLWSFEPDVNRFAGDLIQNNGSQARLNPYFGGTTCAFTDTNSAATMAL